MRQLIKTGLYALFHGVHLLTKRLRNTKDVSVLMYHSIEDTDWPYGVTPSAFTKQIHYLSQNYNVVPLADIVSYAKGETLSDKTTALTFDDGYLGVYETAFPLLKKYRMPATVFLTTNLEEKKVLGNLPRLTEGQIKEMADSGLVSFEVHGHEHHDLRTLGEDAREEEITQSWKAIRALSGQTPQYLAYAFGRKSRDIVAFIRNLGIFKAAFSTHEGMIVKGQDLFQLKRIQVDKTMNMILFKTRLTGAVELMRSITRFFRRR